MVVTSLQGKQLADSEEDKRVSSGLRPLLLLLFCRREKFRETFVRQSENKGILHLYCT